MRRRNWSFIVVALFAQVANAQAKVTTHLPGATISGVVYDSIARMPLADAMIQLVAADNPALLGPTATSDSQGRYTLSDVPDGRYKLGFFHPMLDSLGVEAPLREVSVVEHRAVSADLAIPSPARLRAAVCGKAGERDAGAVVVGVVRDAVDGSSAARVKVIGEWMEIAIDRGGMFRRMPMRTVTTRDNGWFAICNVPSGGTMSLMAIRGMDSTDRIEILVPAEGFLRHELYIGTTRTVVTASAAKPADSIALTPRRVHTGDGHLSGTVIAAVGGKPLAGAQVSIAGGPHVSANERGEWTLTDAPMGTRMLEVRALGYYPERRRVDVVAGAAPVHVALSTFKAVLDTVRIRASRLADRHDSGFESRRRSGAGRYLTAQDISRRGSLFTSDIFRTISGVRVERDASGFEKVFTMRGAFAERCSPAVYIDGHYMATQSADDVDSEMLPKDVAAIEVYSEASVPPQFQQGLSGCGSIVIWTK